VDILDPELSQAIVYMLRMLTSHSLRHHEMYRFYFETEKAFEEKCETVERMGEEAEHMEINALLTDLGITCQLLQLDRTAGDLQVYPIFGYYWLEEGGKERERIGSEKQEEKREGKKLRKEKRGEKSGEEKQGRKASKAMRGEKREGRKESGRGSKEQEEGVQSRKRE
jgi:hypothetical protein